MISNADSYILTFAHNAEEYNPVVDLTYLRVRYYAPTSASFITKDTHLGSAFSINSQNRYIYAQADPINNFDPSGHAISNNSYERQMESLGGINEIYNFYVGQTLSNAHGAANAAFYSQLAYAYGADFTDIDAINSIAYISQATANAYISYGAYMAQNAGSSWGCTAGALTGAAVSSFAANVNASKNSVNSQISAVQANKYQEYEDYQAILAYLAYMHEQIYLLDLDIQELLAFGEQQMVQGITVLEAAYMAQHIYAKYDGKKGENYYLIGGWQLEKVLFGGDGMVMGVYYRIREDGSTEYALVSKGTTMYRTMDWVNNIQAPFGYSADMKAGLEEAIKFVGDLKPGDEVTFVGHSKGGAEAAANAVATNMNAILFNPMSVSLGAYPETKDKTYTASMTAYIVEGDILNNLFGPISTPIDKVVYLPIESVKPEVPVGPLEQAWNDLVASIDRHFMETVIDTLIKEGYK